MPSMMTSFIPSSRWPLAAVVLSVAASFSLGCATDSSSAATLALTHRVEASSCEASVVPNPNDGPTIWEGYSGPIHCRKNSECTAGENGVCQGNPHDGYGCTYDTCFDDGVCGGKVCECDGKTRSGRNVCLSEGNCRVDSDCGEGGACSPSFGGCGSYTGVVGYYCHTAQDECVNDDDCVGTPPAGPLQGTPYCAYSPTAGRWGCSTSQCAG
jgi:hypothetical protein